MIALNLTTRRVIGGIVSAPDNQAATLVQLRTELRHCVESLRAQSRHSSHAFGLRIAIEHINLAIEELTSHIEGQPHG